VDGRTLAAGIEIGRAIDAGSPGSGGAYTAHRTTDSATGAAPHAQALGTGQA